MVRRVIGSVLVAVLLAAVADGGLIMRFPGLRMLILCSSLSCRKNG